MPNAKGFFKETHPNFIGMYLGPVSTSGCSEIVESADAYLFAGPIFSDYTTAGYSTLIDPRKLIEVGPDRVRLPGHDFSHINMREFLLALAKQIKKNNTSKLAYDRIKGKASEPEAGDTKRPLTSARLRANVQKLLDKSTCLVAETGDSWFAGLKMSLPEGANFEFQMQWGSIGWATPAVLGLALGHGKSRRIVAMIGDGSFQLTAQEVSTMIRYSVNPIIFLINNGGYTIEAEIHDGPYNIIKNWHYAELVKVFNAEDGRGFSARVNNESELLAAIETAMKHSAPSLIECIIDRDDCTKQLLQLGSRVAATNARPPKC
jgi:TPP-dependent 2-oxoacid decarboxylase